MNNCPSCDSDSIHTESSREMQRSNVRCYDCGFSIAAQVTEECIVAMWNAIRPDDCVTAPDSPPDEW